MDPANTPNNDEPAVIHSEYESEPAIAEILNVFLDGLSEMLLKMRLAMMGGNGPALAALAHQLKGSGGGYGYPMLTDVAAKLERAAKDEDWEMIAAHLAKLESLSAAVFRGRKTQTGEQS
jgi:HPt (histidine-containing phosphotransfer) domain-containing protein